VVPEVQSLLAFVHLRDGPAEMKILRGDPRGRPLSHTQRRILELLIEGNAMKRAAYELAMAEDTARTHLTRAKEKLGAKTNIQAVAMYAVLKAKEEI
jgi:DNA-binding CsgD family transcriptional regulator